MGGGAASRRLIHAKKRGPWRRPCQPIRKKQGEGAGGKAGRSLLPSGPERFDRVGMVQRAMAVAEARRRADRLLHIGVGAEHRVP